MPDHYRLRKDIFGVPSRNKEIEVITIPADSILQVFNSKAFGLIDVLWEKRSVWVFALDVFNCGDRL